MSNRTRWRVVPESRFAAGLCLIAGVLVLAGALWQMQDGGGVAVLPAIGMVAAVALIVVAVVGLVKPGLRGR
jgi:hypothetical protein